MAQAGYTPIQLYYSSTASAVPVAGNMADGELAINITDGKLFYKNNGGVVTDYGANFASVTGVQTLTNKTLTTPVISGTPSTTAGSRGYDTTYNVPTYYNGTAAIKMGFLNVPQNSQNTAYTLVASDAGKHILHPSADTTARIFTIPANASVAYDIGTSITFVNQNGAGTITIAITSDTMRLAGAGTTGSRTLAANGIATALKITATEWIISGTNLT